MIQHTCMGRKKTPRWKQSLVSRSRQPSCVLLDILWKMRKDSAPILVQYGSRFPEMRHLDLSFEEYGIKLDATLVRNGHEIKVRELVSHECSCVFEMRALKWDNLMERLGRRMREISEFRLYFEHNGKRVTSFEFYLDPRSSRRLMVDTMYAHDVAKMYIAADYGVEEDDEQVEEVSLRVIEQAAAKLDAESKLPIVFIKLS